MSKARIKDWPEVIRNRKLRSTYRLLRLYVTRELILHNVRVRGQNLDDRLGEPLHVSLHHLRVGTLKFWDHIKALRQLREDVHHGIRIQGVLSWLLELNRQTDRQTDGRERRKCLSLIFNCDPICILIHKTKSTMQGFNSKLLLFFFFGEMRSQKVKSWLFALIC